MIKQLFSALPDVSAEHAHETNTYKLLEIVARREIAARFSSAEAIHQDFGPFGSLAFPYVSMGAVDSLDLFGLDELILFSFYWSNRARYRRVADIGANIGLHSILLSRCGFSVRSYEPDPMLFETLQANVRNNGCAEVECIHAAVSATDGTREFVRVLGNLTGSHLAGSKADPYGDLERFPVNVRSIGAIMDWADLLKIDAEGHEREILEATSGSQWRRVDAMIEVGNAGNARAVFEHLSREGVSMFAQKSGWRKITAPEQMPTSYREGSLFITTRDRVPWGDSPGA